MINNEKALKRTKQRDARKAKLCKEHGIKLLYFAYNKYADNVITDINELINKIIEK